MFMRFITLEIVFSTATTHTHTHTHTHTQDFEQVPAKPSIEKRKSVGHIQTESVFHQVERELRLLEAMYSDLRDAAEDVPRLKEIRTRLTDETNRGKVRYVLDTTPVAGRTNAHELRAHRKALSRRTEELLGRVQARLQRIATPKAARAVRE